MTAVLSALTAVTTAFVRDRRALQILGVLLALILALVAPGEAGAWSKKGS